MKICENILSALILFIISVCSTDYDENTVLRPFQNGFKCSSPTEKPKYGCSIDGLSYMWYYPAVNRSVVVTVKYLNSSDSFEAAVECFASTKFTDLPHIELNRSVKIVIKECALPPDRPLLNTIKIQPEENVIALEIINHHLGNDTRYTSTQFDGLRNVQILYWDVKTKVDHLDQDVFNKLISLKKLKILGSSNSLIESKVFSNQPNYEVLTTSRYELLYISEATFKGKNFLKILNLRNRSIVSLHRNAFSSLINLTDLDLSDNWIEKLPDSLLSNNHKLETFRMNFNQHELMTLPNKFLAGFPLLKDVQFIRDGFKHLPNDVFEGSKDIILLFLSNNHLRNIPDSLFRDQLHLEILHLEGNDIETLPNNLFTNTQSLKVLQLSGNKLLKIKEGTFAFLPNLGFLHLGHNKLQYIDPSIFYRTTNFTLPSNLHNSHVTVESSSSDSPFESINDRQILNLHNSKKVFSDWNSLTTQLKHLDLSYNIITNLSIDNLRFPSSDMTIKLTNNRISLISMKQLKILDGKSIEINVNNNPLNCDCNILEFIQHLQATENQNIQFLVENLQCIEPRQLQNVQVNQLQLKNLTCPFLSDHCPKECACSFTTATTVSINCSNRGFTKVPEIPMVRQFDFTSYELHIEDSFISTLPSSNLTGYSDVTALYLANNSIENLSVNHLPQGLNILNLAHNKLAELDELVLQELNQSKKLKALWLSGNQWRCDCPALQFINYVQHNRPIVEDVSEIECYDGRILHSLTANDLCFESHTSLIIIFIALSTCALSFGILLMLFYKHRIPIKLWLYNHNLIVTEDDIDRDKPYDAFISYSYKDENFVADHLIPRLEGEPMKFNVCWHMRDWIPGELIPTQIAKSIENSRRTVIVLSQNFLESFWGQLEFRAAHLASMAEKRVRVIVIMYGEIEMVTEMDRELQAYLKTNIYLKWGDPWFWNKLNDAISCTKSNKQLRKSTVNHAETIEMSFVPSTFN